MDSETKVLAYAAGGMLSVGSAVGLGYVLGGPVGACMTAGAIGGVLLALVRISGLKTPPVARERRVYEIRDGETPQQAAARLGADTCEGSPSTYSKR